MRPPVLMLHGEPTWSYLYRHMIPPFVDAGISSRRTRPHRLRQVRQAVDLADYSYQRHVDWTFEWLTPWICVTSR